MNFRGDTHHKLPAIRPCRKRYGNWFLICFQIYDNLCDHLPDARQRLFRRRGQPTQGNSAHSPIYSSSSGDQVMR
jgi:hypothetical protein